MKILKALFRFYIESSIHVSLAICALAGVTVLTYGLPWDGKVFSFLFLAAITGYNFTKYAEVAGLHHRSLTNQLKIIQIFSLLCFLLLLYTISLQTYPFLWTTTVLGFFTFFYAIPFLPHNKNLRQLKGIKIFVVALVWAGATLWLVLIDHRPLFSWAVLGNTIRYFVFVLALILPFEIRDLQYDDPELGTMPQRLGIPKTKALGYGLLCIFILISILLPLSTLYEILSAVGIAVLTAVFIYYAEDDQGLCYAPFWVESVPIIWFLLLWIPQC